MKFQREIGQKGQVVIPIDIRRMLGLRENSSVIFEIVGEEVKLKSQEDPEKYVEDFFNTPKLKNTMNSKELKKVIFEQYDKKIR